MFHTANNIDRKLEIPMLKADLNEIVCPQMEMQKYQDLITRDSS